jgi:hypothetical protein
MLKLRLAILGATAALALGTATALAMTGAVPFGDGDSHGDGVASAARSCPHGADGVHGACVSSVARTNSPSQSNEDNGNEPAFVKACKAARATTTGDKHGHRGIGACVSAHAKAQAGSDGSSDSESDSDSESESGS